MMTVEIRINDEVIHEVYAYNRGTISGQYEPGDHEGGGGERVYEFHGDAIGSLLHARSDGAVALAIKLLEQLLPPALPTKSADRSERNT